MKKYKPFGHIRTSINALAFYRRLKPYNCKKIIIEYNKEFDYYNIFVICTEKEYDKICNELSKTI